jgi:hypothetical protein
MTAEESDVGDENIAGGFAMMERYARLAVRTRCSLALDMARVHKKKLRGVLTDNSVTKYDEKAGVVYPLYFEAPGYVLPF